VTPDPVFSFEDVVVELGGSRILDGVTASVASGGVTVLLGPSGAGKTTMLRLCNRLEVPSSGCVRFRGEDVASLDPLALRRRVGMVFQRPTLFPGTVRDNLLEARPDGDDQAVGDALERAGLDAGFLDRTGDDLSGGEAQRACLARTLLTRPEVLLMDEPTSSLDPNNVRLLERLARELAGTGVTVLWVTHDLAQAARVGDHEIVVVDGRVADADQVRRFRRSEADADD